MVVFQSKTCPSENARRAPAYGPSGASEAAVDPRQKLSHIPAIGALRLGSLAAVHGDAQVKVEYVFKCRAIFYCVCTCVYYRFLLTCPPFCSPTNTTGWTASRPRPTAATASNRPPGRPFWATLLLCAPRGFAGSTARPPWPSPTTGECSPPRLLLFHYPMYHPAVCPGSLDFNLLSIEGFNLLLTEDYARCVADAAAAS